MNGDEPDDLHKPFLDKFRASHGGFFHRHIRPRVSFNDKHDLFPGAHYVQIYELQATFKVSYTHYDDEEKTKQSKIRAEKALLSMLYAPVYAHIDRLKHASYEGDEDGINECIEAIKREVGV